MMRVTPASPARLRRLAAAARSLASDCAEQRAPFLGSYRLGGPGAPCCALGHVRERAKAWNNRGRPSFKSKTAPLVIAANDEAACHYERQAALVFPLLALADELSAAARKARS